MRRSVDDIAGIFLEDLGLSQVEKANYPKGEDVDYLPVRTNAGELARRKEAHTPELSPYESHRLTSNQRHIVEQIREGALIQGGIDSLITEAKKRSGKQRLHSIIQLEGELHQMLLIRRLTQAQDEELGKLMGPVINREIHARANGITALDDIAEELYLKDIERTYTDITSEPRRRQTFWDNVLGR